MCTICQGGEGGVVASLECGHAFHLRCLEAWVNAEVNVRNEELFLGQYVLHNTRKCPNCRTTFNSIRIGQDFGQEENRDEEQGAVGGNALGGGGDRDGGNAGQGGAHLVGGNAQGGGFGAGVNAGQGGAHLVGGNAQGGGFGAGVNAGQGGAHRAGGNAQGGGDRSGVNIALRGGYRARLNAAPLGGIGAGGNMQISIAPSLSNAPAAGAIRIGVNAPEGQQPFVQISISEAGANTPAAGGDGAVNISIFLDGDNAPTAGRDGAVNISISLAGANAPEPFLRY